MSDAIYWVLELEVQPGKLADFKKLAEEMVESTRKEAGTLAYEWTLGPDGKTCHIHERYADSAAVLAHLGAFGSKFADRFLAALRPTRFVVHGKPDAKAKEALAGFSPIYMDPLAGFHR